MKKFAAIIALLIFFASMPRANAGMSYFYAPYNCSSSIAGFNLTPVPQGYVLTGPVYVPTPGYTASITAANFSSAEMQDVGLTLTLIPPTHIISQYALPRPYEVPPLWVNYSFPSTVPIHRLTISIANPVNRFDTQITCLPTGVSQ